MTLFEKFVRDYERERFLIVCKALLYIVDTECCTYGQDVAIEIAKYELGEDDK